MHEDETDARRHLSIPKNATWLDRIVIRAGWAMSWLFLAGVTISVYEIVARYVFAAPTRWVHETTIFMVAACLLLGGAHCLALGEHIRIGIVADRFPPRLRRAIALINTVLIAVFLGMLIYATSLMAKRAWVAPSGDLRLETSGSAWNPPYPAILKAFLLVIVVVMLAQALLHVWRAIKESVRGRGDAQ